MSSQVKPSLLEIFVVGKLQTLEDLSLSVINRIQSNAQLYSRLRQLGYLVTSKSFLGGAAVTGILGSYLYSQIPKRIAPDTHDPTKRRKVSKDFIIQLKRILRILIPTWKSKEMFILAIHTAFLVSRTFLSIYIAGLDGAIVRSLVDRNGKKFVYLLMLWFAVAIPATTVNSMIKYMESKLSLAFRTRLTKYTYGLYMQDEIYYRVGNLDSRVANADQCLTEDVFRFSNQLAHLHSQLSKPILDVVVIAIQLIRSSNKQRGSSLVSCILAYVVIYGTAKALQFFQPPFGKLAAQQASLEGDLRYVHSRLITNSEEISFYRGHEIESNILMDRYLALVKHMNKIFKTRIFYGIIEGFFMKYVWSACGLLIVAIPAFFFDPNKGQQSSEILSDRTQDYVTSKMLLASAAEAIERIMLAFKEVNELAGYTSRVSNMINVFNDVKNERYEKVMVRGDSDQPVATDGIKTKGTCTESENIKFDSVPIVSPNGDVLVQSMSFEAKPGMHVLITGPNGCGKSSLFRILGGLWPVTGGSVCKPNYKEMFYIPQRPYLSLGTLRDQVIYPDTVDEMKKIGKTDKDLEDILSWVNLLHILSREGGWNAMNEWKDVLSGGEKQRLGMARLFYHKPRYAILDECTSAVSMDVEGKMYQHAIDEGITLLTVTHRPSLWKYHNYLLCFDGEGNAKFSSLNSTERLSLKEEKSKIENNLTGVPKMQARLRDLCVLLGEDSVLLKLTTSASVEGLVDVLDDDVE